MRGTLLPVTQIEQFPKLTAESCVVFEAFTSFWNTVTKEESNKWRIKSFCRR